MGELNISAAESHGWTPTDTGRNIAIPRCRYEHDDGFIDNEEMRSPVPDDRQTKHGLLLERFLLVRLTGARKKGRVPQRLREQGCGGVEQGGLSA